MHGTEQSWRYAKSPFKSIVEPDRGQPDLGCDTLERQVAVNERACRFQAEGFDEMRVELRIVRYEGRIVESRPKVDWTN